MSASCAGDATGGDFGGGGGMPPVVAEGFSAAMAQAMLLPAAVIALGVVLVLFLRRPAHLAQR